MRRVTSHKLLGSPSSAIETLGSALFSVQLPTLMSKSNPVLQSHLYPNISVIEMIRPGSRESTKLDRSIPVPVKAVTMPALGVCVRI